MKEKDWGFVEIEKQRDASSLREEGIWRSSLEVVSWRRRGETSMG